MQPSDEIMALEPRQNQPYQSTYEFLWGFKEAKMAASMIAYSQELVSEGMKQVLESINTSDPAIAEALGAETVLDIRCALIAYREQQIK